MKLSEKTIKILKNFSSITQSILFRTGTIIRTRSPMHTIAAQAVVDETFPFEFGIYDLVGNVGEWVEHSGEYISKGGNYITPGDSSELFILNNLAISNDVSSGMGCRVMLTIN